MQITVQALIAVFLAAADALKPFAAGDTGTASSDKTETKTSTKGAAKGDKTPTKPKGPSREEVVAALTQVKEKFGATVAKEIISEKSSAAKMAEIPDSELKAVFDAAQAKLEGKEESTDDGDDGL